MPLVVYIVHALLTLNWFWNCRLVHHLLLSSTNLQIHTLVSGTCYIIVFMCVKIRFNCSLNPSRSVLSALCVIIIMSFVIASSNQPWQWHYLHLHYGSIWFFFFLFELLKDQISLEALFIPINGQIFGWSGNWR
jgi:membrane-associated HD superfamily phosphohydrolase